MFLSSVVVPVLLDAARCCLVLLYAALCCCVLLGAAMYGMSVVSVCKHVRERVRECVREYV